MYTLKEIIKNRYVIYIDSKEIYNIIVEKIKDIGKMCDWNGAYCYDPIEGMYSSSSSATNPGFYKGRKIVQFDEIIEEDLEPLIFN